jgi:hypothetical protein
LDGLGFDGDIAKLSVVHVRSDIFRFAVVDTAWDAVPLVVADSDFRLLRGMGYLRDPILTLIGVIIYLSYKDEA